VKIQVVVGATQKSIWRSRSLEMMCLAPAAPPRRKQKQDDDDDNNTSYLEMRMQ
jgi:hypothetical protein